MPKSPQMPELIPTIEVAALARVDVATVNRWARTGRLVAAMKVPGQTGPNLFRRTDVDRLLKSRRDADAARQPAIEVNGDPMPDVTLTDVWHELSGYVQQAAEDGSAIDPVLFLEYMIDLRHRAYQPVHEWWRRNYDFSPLGLPNPPSPWDPKDVT